MDDTVLLAGIVGSTAYGLAHPGSDVDRLGMYAAPTVAFHGLRPPTGRFASKVTSHPDVTYHEAAKYCLLALGGNPTASELMWLPRELYDVVTPLGEALIGIRTAFLSAPRVRDAYLGYAAQQLQRLVSRDPARLDQRAAKHARHLYRLCWQGFAVYTTGDLPIRLDDPHRCRDFGERVAAGDYDLARGLLADYEQRFTAAEPAVPETPDEPVVEDWLLQVRRTFC